MASSHRSLILVTKDDAISNLYWIERDAKPVLMQVLDTQYELWQGRCILGVVVFENGPPHGWRFYPRSPGRRPSRKLHPNAEAALGGGIPVDAVYTKGRLGKLA